MRIEARLTLQLIIATATAAGAVSCGGETSHADAVDFWPPEAIASLVVPNLSATNAKVAMVGEHLGISLPEPLTLLSSAGRIGVGLDTGGTCSISLLAPEGDSPLPVPCLQVAVSDYRRFLASLGGHSTGGIATVHIADETLLIAQRGSSALIMDQGNRQRLEALLNSSGPMVLSGDGRQWLQQMDLALYVNRAALGELWHDVEAPAATLVEESQDLDDLLDEPTDLHIDASPANELAAEWPGAWAAMTSSVRAWVQKNPLLGDLATQADFAMLGLHVAPSGDTTLELRADWRDDAPLAASMSRRPELIALERFSETPFVVAGGGSLGKEFVHLLAKYFVTQQLLDFQEYGDGAFPEDSVARVHRAVGEAMSNVTGFLMLEKPVSKPAAVFSNRFLLLETSAGALTRDKINDAMRAWNWLMDHAHGDACLQFAARSAEIAGKPAVEYTADMAAAVGAAPLPEVKTTMEELFGPGGLLRIQLVLVDEHRVLLANASANQTESFLGALVAEKARLSESAEILPAKRLLAPSRHFELFLTPHEFTERLRREKEAGTENIIGGPLVRPFPVGPAVAAAVENQAGRLNLQLVVPAESLRGWGEYLRRRK